MPVRLFWASGSTFLHLEPPPLSFLRPRVPAPRSSLRFLLRGSVVGAGVGPGNKLRFSCRKPSPSAQHSARQQEAGTPEPAASQSSGLGPGPGCPGRVRTLPAACVHSGAGRGFRGQGEPCGAGKRADNLRHLKGTACPNLCCFLFPVLSQKGTAGQNPGHTRHLDPDLGASGREGAPARPVPSAQPRL